MQDKYLKIVKNRYLGLYYERGDQEDVSGGKKERGIVWEVE